MRNTIYRLILIICLLPVAASAQELPRAYLDTRMPAANGKSFNPTTAANLQAAINQAVSGDTINLDNALALSGNFTLPGRANASPAIIRAANLSALPENTRVAPTAALPKLISPNADPAIKALPGASGWRLIGLEITVAAGWAQNHGLVVLGDGETSLDAIPNNITIDRCYIHGNQTGNVTRGVTLNSKSTAVIDSHISNIHGVGYDTQAICGWQGPGPFKIVNNYLEGAGENVMFGGADPKIANLVPSDIEFRRNYCSKPLSWKVGDPTFAGTRWSIKNLFELKNAQRVLIDGNVFENCWLEAQVGFAVQITTRNQEGTAPWSVVSDVTYTNNIVRHAGAGINILGRDDNNPSQQAARILIQNNLFDDVGAARWGGNGRFLQITETANVKVDHNTVFHTDKIITAYGVANTGFIYTNNISLHNEYGVMGDGSSPGNATISKYFPGSLFSKNIIAGGNQAIYPANNFFPANLDAVGFADRAGSNYRLAASSPYKGKATDGKDIGADMDAIAVAMAGSGTTPTPPPGLPPPTPPPVFTLPIPKDAIEIVFKDKAGNVIGTIKLNPPQ